MGTLTIKGLKSTAISRKTGYEVIFLASIFFFGTNAKLKQGITVINFYMKLVLYVGNVKTKRWQIDGGMEMHTSTIHQAFLLCSWGIYLRY